MTQCDTIDWRKSSLPALPHEVALETRPIRLPHQDPADRFLAATARVFELTLVTADARLLETKGLPVLPNR